MNAPIRPPVSSPFHAYGLYRNPFGELSRAERAELAVIDVEPLLERLGSERSVLQVIGPCGHGKTTHLLALGKRLAGSAYVYFPEEGTQLHLPKTRPLLVDEAQRMRFWRRRELLRGSGPLVIGTHVDLTRTLRRAGFDVHTVDVSQPKSAEQVQRMLMARIVASQVSHSPALQDLFDSELRFGDIGSNVPRIHLEQVVAWQGRFGSNIRALEHFLYEDFQQAVRERRSWPNAT